MYSHPSCMLRCFARLFLAVSLMCSSEAIAADTIFDNARSANQAMESVANARLELEQLNLVQLRKLNAKGFATWLELSRQQVLVNGLAAQRDSLQRYNRFIAQIETQVDRLARETSTGEMLSSERNPVKIYMPGSLRLIGWIEHDVVGRQQVDSIRRPTSRTKAASDDRMIHLAEQRLRKAELRCRGFVDAESALHHWQRLTQLQRNVARSELELLRLQRVFSITDAPIEPSVELHELIDNNTFVHADDSRSELAEATYKVMRAEAGASGRLKSAEITLRRQTLRMKSLEKLHAGGHATSSQIKRGNKQLEAAVAALEQERARIVELTQICETARQSLGQFDDSTVPDFSARFNDACAWPKQVLCDADRLKHLIDLRRQYFNVLGQRETCVSHLKMKQSYLTKLQTALAKTQQSSDPQISDTSPADLRLSLTTGETRQLESLRLDIDYLKARIKALGEMLAILVVEENRFIAQVLQQDNANNDSFVQSDLGASSVTPVSFSTKDRIQPKFSYLEFRSSSELYDDLSLTYCKPRYFDFQFDQRNSSPLLHVARYSQIALPTARKYDSDVRNKSKFQQRADSSRLPGKISYGNFRRFGPYSSRFVYPYGSLRADLRNDFPPGFPPWYIPGRPINLQK